LSFFNKIRSLIRNKVWQKLFENFLSLSVLQALVFVTELITLPYLTRILGADFYGIISFAVSFIFFLQVITEYGFNHSGTRAVSKYREDKEKIQKIYSSINLVRIILSCICLLSLITFVNVFERFRENSIIFLLLFGLIIQSVLSPTWYFRGIEKMKYLTIIHIIGKILLIVLIFSFIKSESDYILYAFLVFSNAILIGIVTQIFIIKKYKIKFHTSSLNDIKYQFSSGFYMFLVYLSTNIITNLNPFILGLLVDYYYVGIFSAGYRIIQIFILVISLITTTVFPHIVKLISERKNGTGVNVFSFIKKILLIIILIGTLSLIFLLISADLIVNLFFGVEYAETVNLIRILSFAPLLIGIGHTLTLQILVPLEFDSLVAKIYGVSAIFNLVACFIFIPIYGYIGLCVIILITRMIPIILSLIWIRRNKTKLSPLTI
jgi:PST family polysaccharide transporter